MMRRPDTTRLVDQGGAFASRWRLKKKIRFKGQRSDAAEPPGTGVCEREGVSCT